MRNNFIDDCIFKFEISIFFVWCKFDLYVIVLIFIIRLMYKFIFGLSVGMESFMVRYLRCIYVSFNFEFMMYMVNDDI